MAIDELLALTKLIARSSDLPKVARIKSVYHMCLF